MDTIESIIKKELEETYDIPFIVTASSTNNEIEYLISPENSGKELFGIRVMIRNNIRLIMDFIPEKYSANFIRSLPSADDSGKRLFAYHARFMEAMGAKVDIRVNERDLRTQFINEWPQTWNSLNIRVNKIIVDDTETAEQLLTKWSSIYIGMVLALANIITIDASVYGFAEGRKEEVLINKYERNRMNRNLCLRIHGYACKVCGFNFEKFYGEIGHNFIHVHHIVPVSEIGEDYIIDPAIDLIPVCPNCHAMLHQSDPPLLPQELQDIIQDNSASKDRFMDSHTDY